MESAVGYVILTAFLVLLLISTSATANQLYTINVTGNLNVQLRSLAQLVRQQMICAYETMKQQSRESQTARLIVDMPRTISGRPYGFTLENGVLKAQCLNVHYEVSMPSFSDVQWVIEGGEYKGGSGKLIIEAEWTEDIIDVAIVPG